MKFDPPKIAPDQLQPAKSADVLRSKFDPEKSLARRMKIRSTQSHLEWPPCRVIRSVSQLLYLLQPVGHFKFLFHQLFVGLGLTALEGGSHLERLRWRNRQSAA